LGNKENLLGVVILAAACPKPNISQVGNLFLWVAARKVLF
jgi:hypothetical protein